MEIVKTSGELTPQQQYYLVMSPTIQKMKDAIGQEIELSHWCIYKDLNSKNEEQTILSIATPENDILATNSPTFIEDFEKMHDMFAKFNTPVKAITVTSGTSKAGRVFITCIYAR